MLNIEKYKEDILNMSHANITCCVGSLNHVEDCTNRLCKECKKEALKWLLSEAQILDDAEKRYLRGVIRPFRNRVAFIKKTCNCVGFKWIEIAVEGNRTIVLPGFKNDEMYKGMELEKEYTLEELGL